VIIDTSWFTALDFEVKKNPGRIRSSGKKSQTWMVRAHQKKKKKKKNDTQKLQN
jgi:Tfp pilus assembly protein FimT